MRPRRHNLRDGRTDTNTPVERTVKLLFDLFPIILFFAAFKFGQSDPAATADWIGSVIGGAAVAPDQAPVLLATLVGIVATFVQIGLVFLKGRRPEPMLWISLAVIVVFGSLTLWLHNEMFIKWKPTILYWIFGSILLFGEFTRRNFLTMLLGKQLELPPSAWGVMQRAWIGFFYITGIINLIVAYAFSTETWVNFKLFGLLALTFIFTIAISVWVMKKTESLTK